MNSDDSAVFGGDNNESIYQLLEKMTKIEGDFKIAISEFNPRGLFNSKIEQILLSNKIIYITIPIQSGSQRILNKMKRPYRIEKVIDKISNIKKRNPKLIINTHIMVGFPCETEKDFMKTLKIIKSGLFDRVKVFIYSDRPKTESVNYYPKISSQIKILRAKKIRHAAVYNSYKKRSLSNLLLNLRTI